MCVIPVGLAICCFYLSYSGADTTDRDLEVITPDKRNDDRSLDAYKDTTSLEESVKTYVDITTIKNSGSESNNDSVTEMEQSDDRSIKTCSHLGM